MNRRHEEFRKQTDYISMVFIHTERERAGVLVLVSLQGPVFRRGQGQGHPHRIRVCGTQTLMSPWGGPLEHLKLLKMDLFRELQTEHCFGRVFVYVVTTIPMSMV